MGFIGLIFAVKWDDPQVWNLGGLRARVCILGDAWQARCDNAHKGLRCGFRF